VHVVRSSLQGTEVLLQGLKVGGDGGVHVVRLGLQGTKVLLQGLEVGGHGGVLVARLGPQGAEVLLQGLHVGEDGGVQVLRSGLEGAEVLLQGLEVSDDGGVRVARLGLQSAKVLLQGLEVGDDGGVHLLGSSLQGTKVLLQGLKVRNHRGVQIPAAAAEHCLFYLLTQAGHNVAQLPEVRNLLFVRGLVPIRGLAPGINLAPEGAELRVDLGSPLLTRRHLDLRQLLAEPRHSVLKLGHALTSDVVLWQGVALLCRRSVATLSYLVGELGHFVLQLLQAFCRKALSPVVVFHAHLLDEAIVFHDLGPHLLQLEDELADA